MTIDKNKVLVLIAKDESSISAFCEKVGCSRTRFYTVLNSKNVTPKTAGKFARALGVDVTEII